MTDSSPLISVLMPSLNVGPYIRACIESVVNQTLENIEILCIDAGSTDGTLEVLREYEQADPRVQVIVSDVKSYGYQMNLGLRAARGQYIGIVETDDFADKNMYERLYETACEFNAQVIKANYYTYQTTPVEEDVFFERYAGFPYLEVLGEADRVRLIAGGPSIWSGIYQRDMLIDNNIDFLETPGASYQDTAFILKVWMAAKSVVLVKDAFLHYRTDNEDSSVHSAAKVYCVCDEMASAHEFMNQREEWRKQYSGAMWSRQADAYVWNYERIPDESKLPFLLRASEEFKRAEEIGELQEASFTPPLWAWVTQVKNDPQAFYEGQRAAAEQQASEPQVANEPSPEVGAPQATNLAQRGLAWLRRTVRGIVPKK